MTTIIITIVLNLLIGTPTQDQNTLDDTADTTTTTPTTTTDPVTTMGGTGNWTNVDK